MSLPSWERGLKLSYAYHYATEMAVAPLVGAWVEIKDDHALLDVRPSRSPRGSVG